MVRKRLGVISLTLCLALFLVFCGILSLGGFGARKTAAEPADYAKEENIADSVYDFTFTNTAAFASKWGNQAATVEIRNADRTMKVAAEQYADGVMQTGSYHTKFDVKFGAGNWYSLFLRHNSGSRGVGTGNYKASCLDTGADRGYRLFIQNQYLQLMETNGSMNNGITISAGIDTANPLGADKYYTFEIWVLNLTDGSVQLIVDVDGKNYINANTSSIKNSLFDKPITEGAMRIFGSGVATEYRGYASETDRRLELFSAANFDNWTGQTTGAGGASPISWTDGGFKVGDFTDTLTGWPASLTKGTALVGSGSAGSFSSLFTFKGKRVSDSSVPYNLTLAYLEPGVKTIGWAGTTQNALLNEGNWVNGYVLWINSTGSVELMKGTNAGEVKQMRWSNPNIEFTDGAEHTFYFSVKNSPDRSYQVVTLEIDGILAADFHSYMPYTMMGGSMTELSDAEKEKWLESCPKGSFQIVTQNISGTFLNAGDTEFTDGYFQTDMSPVANNPSIETGITLENGVLTVPRGDKNGTDGNGWHWQEQVPVVTSRVISATSTIAFDFSAVQIEGKTAQLFINTNNENQYPTTGTASGKNACIYSDGSSMYFVGGSGNGFWNGMSLVDGNTHRVVISSARTNEGLTVKLYADGVLRVYYTYAENEYLHDGYFNMFARGLDNITVSDFSVYENTYETALRLSLSGTPKTEYTVGEQADFSGLSARVVYADGTYEEIAVVADMVSGFDSSSPAENLTLTVSFAGASASYSVTVKSGETASYKVKEGWRSVYGVGESYAEDIVVVKTLGEEITEIPVTADMVSGFDTSLGGIVTLTISVDGTELILTVTVEKRLTGIAVESGYRSEYAIGVSFDYTDLMNRLILSYDDGTEERADITAAMLSRRGAAAGENTIVVSYGGFETALKITGTGEDEWDKEGDGAIRAALPEINVADGKVMSASAYAQTSGNTVSFGPSNGSFAVYNTAEVYTDYRMSFEMKILPEAADANQRIMLRASVADSYAMNGYYLLLYKTSWHLYRKPSNCLNENGYRVAAASFQETAIGGGELYDGRYHNVVIETFNRADGKVVLNMMIDGVHVMHFADSDDITQIVWSSELIPEADRRVYSEPGYVGFMMNSAAAWTLKGEYTDAAFSPDVFLGNPSLYAGESTASAALGRITFLNGETAVLNDEYESFNAAFALKFSSLSDGELFALSLLSSRANRADYAKADGFVVRLYADRAEAVLNGKVLATLGGLSIRSGESVEIKLSVGFLGGEALIGFGVNGVWAGAFTASSALNTSGFVGLFAFSDCELTAESSAVRNYRVLFVGNSITNHGPNADLGYTLGGGAESWGMATSAPEYDYVHLVMAEIRKVPGYENAEFMAINVANWEREYASYDYVRYFSEGAVFEPDLIVGRLGENANSCAASYKLNNDFAHYYDELLRFFDSKGTAKIILTTSYWGDEHYDRDNVIDAKIVGLARKKNYPLVRLGDLGSLYKAENDASADGEYYRNLEGVSPGGLSWEQEWNNWSGAVKTHPGMTGMRNIAARISESAVNLLSGGDAYIFKYEEVSEGIFAEYISGNLYGDVAGAYAHKKTTAVSLELLANAEGYEFAENYLLYKAFSFSADGDVYRLSMRLYADRDASFLFKVYTTDAEGNLVELSYYTDTESSPEPVLALSGKFGDKLFFCVEYDAETIFADAVFSEPKYGNLLTWLNEDSETFRLDVGELGYDNLTIARNVYSVIISSGKDLFIRFESGTVRVAAETFEVIAATEKDLYFSVTQIASSNYLKNAAAAVESLDGNYYFLSENASGYVNEVFETQISYNGRSGDALYINKGVRVDISVSLTAEQAQKLAVITAVLPALGSDVKYVEILSEENWTYADGILSLFVKDFDSDVILALKGAERSISLEEGCKTEYKVGETLALDTMTLVVSERDGSVSRIPVTADMVSGFDSSEAGTLTIEISYDGLSCSLTVTVTAEGGNSSASEDSSENSSGNSDSGLSSGGSATVGCGNCNGGMASAMGMLAVGIAAALLIFKRKSVK